MITIVRVHVCIYYYRPDFKNLLQEFHWATDDQDPHLPRVHRFLAYWKDNVDAVIREVLLTKSRGVERDWQRVDREILH